jgi:ribonuclease HII
MLKRTIKVFPEAGCDEAGRGCLAGPVVAAAVILPRHFRDPGLNDSKKLSAAAREAFAPLIMQKALAVGVGIVDNETIDRINILQASILAMHLALEQLQMVPAHIVVDGNRFRPFRNIPHTCIIKGDSSVLSIAAASIIAKTTRDKLMMELDASYPEYGWKTNMGYGTAAHREVMRNLGQTPYHRKSFVLKEFQKKLEF